MITKRDRRLGKSIKHFREQAGLTQERLAEKADLSSVHISYIETAARTPDLKTLYKIADALKVKVKNLFPF